MIVEAKRFIADKYWAYFNHGDDYQIYFFFVRTWEYAFGHDFVFGSFILRTVEEEGTSEDWFLVFWEITWMHIVRFKKMDLPGLSSSERSSTLYSGRSVEEMSN